jgi:hypothetical protein
MATLRFPVLKWYRYITGDAATAASQNGFSPYKLSFHKKINIIQNMTKTKKNFISFAFYHSSCETRSLYDTFLELCKHCVLCSEEAVAKSNVMYLNLLFFP